MKLDNYGIVLESLQASDLELLRGWRNSPHIANTMIYREIITLKQQQNWFRNLDPVRELYMLIMTSIGPIGMANLKGIDLPGKNAEAGMFLHDIESQNSNFSYGASLNILDHAFFTLQLETVSGKIIAGNIRALRYNLSLGFEVISTSDILNLQLSKKNYLKKKILIERFLDVKPKLATS